MDDSPNKASQPRHLEMANEVSKELTQNFSGKEQFEFLQEIGAQLENHHKDNITDKEPLLKSVNEQYSEFLGENTPTKIGG